MAKERYINTRFWDDEYIIELNPSEKLLFLYLLTNPLTNISGIYEITLKRMTFDTGFKNAMINKILDRFATDKKIIFKNGWIAIKNFIKYQKINPKIQVGIDNALAVAPQELTKWIKNGQNIDYDSLSKPLNYLNTNINTNKNINIQKKAYAENVLLKEIEYKKLVEKYGESPTRRLIEKLDNAKGSKGYKYNSDYRAILNWVIDALGIKEIPKAKPPPKPIGKPDPKQQEQVAGMLEGLSKKLTIKNGKC